MFRRQRKVNSLDGKSDDNPFLLSYSDIMAGLLIVFILALILFMVQLQKREVDLEKTRIDLIEKEKRLEQTLAYLKKLQKQIILSREQLEAKLKRLQGSTQVVQDELDGIGKQRGSLFTILNGIKGTLADEGIDVEVAENGTVLRIPEESLSFDSGEYEIIKDEDKLTKDEREKLRKKLKKVEKIGEVILKVLQKKENIEILDTVFVEGHTDSVPFDRGEKGNWGLSTYRAISLWQFWTENPGSVKELKDLKSKQQIIERKDLENKFDDLNPALQRIEFKEKALFSVSGYADLRPSGEQQEVPPLRPGQNSKDRRIDIRFTLAPSEEKDLANVKEILLEQQKELDELIRSLSLQMERIDEVDSGTGLDMMEDWDLDIDFNF